MASTKSKSFFKAPVGSSVEVRVNITRVIFEGNDGYGIYQAELDSKTRRTLVIKGVFPIPIKLNSYYLMEGIITERSGERQLEVEYYNVSFPTTPEQELSYLDRITMNSQVSNTLVAVFEGKIFDKILYSPSEVYNSARVKASGIKKERILDIRNILIERMSVNEVFSLLLEFKISKKNIAKIMKEYSSGQILSLATNPYLILSFNVGASFLEVDKIALSKGMPFDSSSRLKEAVVYSLKTLTSMEGHTCYDELSILAHLETIIACPIGANEAKALINNSKNDASIKNVVHIGDSEFEIDIDDLTDKYSKWSISGAYARESFRYPLCGDGDAMAVKALELALLDGVVVKFPNNSGGYDYQFKWYANYESNIAVRLADISTNDTKKFKLSVVESSLEKAISDFEDEHGFSIELEPAQREAILTICRSPFGAFLLTGPAGSGKTFVTSLIMKTLDYLFQYAFKRKHTPSLLAPTGKAAQVLSNATGMPANTIHKAFKIVGDDSSQTPSEPVDHSMVDMFMVDEFSMVEEQILSIMLKHTSTNTKIIFSGDLEQLPSVGAGSCLRDIQRSGVIPWVHLDTVKRQSADSSILVNANRIIKGEPVETIRGGKPDKSGDSYVVIKNYKEETHKYIIDFIKKAGIKRFWDEELQVLCPTKGSIVGTDVINYLTQQELNPYCESSDSEGKGFDCVSIGTKVDLPNGNSASMKIHVGDKVINTKNNYGILHFEKDKGIFKQLVTKGVMNGEIGIVERIYRVNIDRVMTRRVIVKYGELYAYFDGEDIKTLDLAYAITIHKSQGSQWPIVLAPFTGTFEQMYTRALIYTVFTRARNICYIAGTKSSIDFSIQNNRVELRRTRLMDCLLEHFK